MNANNAPIVMNTVRVVRRAQRFNSALNSSMVGSMMEAASFVVLCQNRVHARCYSLTKAYMHARLRTYSMALVDGAHNLWYT